jgi:hypothetical protein
MRLLTVVWTFVKAEWIVVVLALGGIVGLVVVLKTCDDPWGQGTRPNKAKTSDVQLANGDPLYNTVVVYHDNKRNVTCYESTHGGLACFLDITLEDQQGMLAYRDGGR